MMKYFISLTLVCLLSISGATARGIKSLNELSAQKTYLLKNANNYGYCIYNPYIDDKYLSLGGATAEHPSGCINSLYKSPIDPTDADCQWRITPDGKGAYYVYNVGQHQYLTNKYNSYDFAAHKIVYYYKDYYLTSEQTPVTISELKEGVFCLRLAEVTDEFTDNYGNGAFKYMCAATQMAIPISVWAKDDLGSEWYIIDTSVGEVEDKDDGGGDKGGDGDKQEEDEDLGPIRYLTFMDGQMVAIPEKYIIKKEMDEKGLVSLTLTGDTVWTYTQSGVASESNEYVGTLPVFESFKFNNKFNDQLAADADGVIDNENNTIDLTVACIGKRLTPSFKVPEDATVWVNGEQQHSKVSRPRWDKDLTYTLAYPKNWIYRITKVSDEVWSQPDPSTTEDEWILTPITLTSDMLSTNAPSNYPNQTLDMVLDNNTTTYYHSTWGSGVYQKLAWDESSKYGDGKSEWPYIQIEMAEPIQNFQFEYTAGPANRRWQSFILQGSNDNLKWEDIEEFSESFDELPSTDYGKWKSPIITNANTYKYLRWQATSCIYKNYITMAEFSLTKVEPNPDYKKDNFEPELLQPAVYEKAFVPFGRDYKVHVNFLTDKSTGEYKVPRIDINTYNGTMISSKDYYWDASFELTGYGVYEDIYVENMQIKGRGNSSWSNSSSSKNPYRLKFAEKIKPFGLTKGKNWVLLANKQTGSMTTNAIAMKIADMVGTAGCNHIIPVELYINGSYRGSYNFTEKVGFSNNSIDLEDESNAVMLELDSYFDETYKFQDQCYNMYVNVKEPDLADPANGSNLTFNKIKSAFNEFTYDMKIGGWESYAPKVLDLSAMAKAMLVNDLTRNQELKHPKSWFIYNPDLSKDTTWILGPVWDFDWSYGYDGPRTYFIDSAERDILYGLTASNIGYPFFNQLWRGCDAVQKAYYKEWTLFLNSGKLDELIEYCDDYLEFANPSFVHNATMWSDGKAYATHTSNAKNWLTKRANYIYKNLKKFDLSEDIIDDNEDIDFGQPDKVELTTITHEPVDVYTIGGIRMRSQVPAIEATRGLMPGIYIIGGKKVVVR